MFILISQLLLPVFLQQALAEELLTCDHDGGGGDEDDVLFHDQLEADKVATHEFGKHERKVINVAIKAKVAVTSDGAGLDDVDGDDCDLFAIASGVEPAEPPLPPPAEPPEPCPSLHEAHAVWFASAESAAQLLDETEEHAFGKIKSFFLLCTLKGIWFEPMHAGVPPGVGAADGWAVLFSIVSLKF